MTISPETLRNLRKLAATRKIWDGWTSDLGAALDELEALRSAIERVRANWPHIEVPIPSPSLQGKRYGATRDPGAPTCLRCKIEAVLGP